jgi:hypothetical protein
MLIQSPFGDSENKENPAIQSADSGKLVQNPHHPCTKKSSLEVGESSPETDEGGTPST